MRRLVLLMIVLFAFVGSDPVEADSGSTVRFIADGQMLRVSVVQGDEMVRIGGTAGFEVIEQDTGQLLFFGTTKADCRILAPRSGSGQERKWRVQVSASSSPEGAMRCKGLVEQQTGEPAYMVSDGTWYKVQVGDYQQRERAENLRDVLRGQGFADAFVVAGPRVEEPGELRFEIGSWGKWTSSTLLIKPLSGGRLTVEGCPYRGELIVGSRGASGGVNVINVLPLEEYLYGVLASEMPRSASVPLEALKAQAVAARSYALHNLQRFAGKGFDLCSDTSCQVYRGCGQETANIRKAVDATRGLVLTYEGEIINAVYHGSAGGHTADSENVWDGQKVAYLRGVAEIGVRFEAARANGLQANREWIVSWNRSQLQKVYETYIAPLLAANDAGAGELRSLQIMSRDESGRVVELKVTTSRGHHVIRGDRIRRILRQPDGSLLPSTVFELQVETEKGQAVAMTAVGRGRGHGLGLSQVGAIRMAELGYTWEEILAHYYEGTAVNSLQEYFRLHSNQ